MLMLQAHVSWPRLEDELLMRESPQRRPAHSSPLSSASSVRQGPDKENEGAGADAP